MNVAEAPSGDCSVCVLVGQQIKKIVKEKFDSEVIADIALRSVCIGKYNPERKINAALDSAYSNIEKLARELCTKSKKPLVLSFESQVANVLKSEWLDLTKDVCESRFVDMAADLLSITLKELRDGKCTF